MSDTYQAVYDAARSRIGGCDTHDAIQRAMHETFGNVDHQFRCAIQEVSSELTNPSAIYRPKLSVDGNQWCALYGDNLQDGVAGFGESPAKAMRDFDRNWFADIGKEQL